MDDTRTVWCGNLSDQVTEDLLFELFLQAAPLERVKVVNMKEKDSRGQSNFAFVTFKHEESVNYALQLLNGIRLFDKSLTVKPRNSNNQNQPADRSVHRNDYHNKINQALANNELLRMGQLMQPTFEHLQNSYNDRQGGRWDHGSYHERERRDNHGYRKHDYRDNRRNDSPNSRRNNYNDRRNNFNDRNHRRNNRQFY